MDVDNELVESIATNARLTLSEKEKEELVPQLQEVLDIFQSLEEVDTEDTPLAMHPVEIEASPRKDKKEACLSQEEALDNAEHTKDGFFKGPKVME